MKKINPFWKAQNRRLKVLQLARDLARSGQHANHQSILAELESVEGIDDARRRLTDGPITAQLDRMCAMATSAQATGSLSVFLAHLRSGGAPAKPNVGQTPAAAP